MSNVIFDSWLEAYVYQSSSRTDKSDPLFMFEFKVNSGIDAIDNLVATTGNDIVWLVVVEDGVERYVQYGVGRNLKWYSIRFDGFNKELIEVADSLKEYDQLPTLVKNDTNATIIYRYIENIFEVYKFLTNGKIIPSDSVNELFVSNAESMIWFAKEQLAYEDYYDEEDGLLEEDLLEDVCDYCNELESDCECLEEDDEYCEDCDCEEYWEDEDEEKDEDEDEVLGKEDIEEIDELVNLFEKEYETCWNESDDDQLTLDDFLTEETKNTYRFTFGDKSDDENVRLEEVTCEEANQIFDELVENGHKYVELSQIKRLHIFF